jgi:hypothetical protein
MLFTTCVGLLSYIKARFYINWGNQMEKLIQKHEVMDLFCPSYNSRWEDYMKDADAEVLNLANQIRQDKNFSGKS